MQITNLFRLSTGIITSCLMLGWSTSCSKKDNAEIRDKATNQKNAQVGDPLNPNSPIEPVDVTVGGDYPFPGRRDLDAISDGETATFHGNHLGTKGTVRYFAKMLETDKTLKVTISVKTTAEMWTDGAPPPLFRKFTATQETIMDTQGLDLSFVRPYYGRIEVRHNGKVLLNVPLSDLGKADSKELELDKGNFRHEFTGPLEGTNDGVHPWGESDGGKGLQRNPYVNHWFFHEGPAPIKKPSAYAIVKQQVFKIEWFRE